jgi:hypothetical protein
MITFNSPDQFHPNADIKAKSLTAAERLQIPLTTDHTAIIDPAEGLIVENTTTNKTWKYSGGSWREVGGGANFANTDLTLTGDRLHSLNDKVLVFAKSGAISDYSYYDHTFLSIKDTLIESQVINPSDNDKRCSLNYDENQLSFNANIFSTGQYLSFGLSATQAQYLITSGSSQSQVIFNPQGQYFYSYGGGDSSSIICTKEEVSFGSSSTSVTLNSVGFSINRSNSPKLRFTLTDNLLINSTTDSGHKLQVEGSTRLNGAVSLPGLPTYADNAAAISGGLAVNEVYKTSTGELRIVI